MKHGGKVALFDVNDDKGAAAVAELGEANARYFRTDVTDEAGVKALFTNLDQLTAAHAAAKAINAADAAKSPPVPLHPGAEKYYREAGLLK